ncbi:L-type lectin-domain containing receptor kinase IX.1-like [Silene latifolia]|uniref:L-type lectin-domain containing receptor kinase IX.1-like n=1 Tax=Silene latifolia TaxID=37657 RepID=UPI003D773900
MEFGLSMARQMELSHVVLESDYLLLIIMLKSKEVVDYLLLIIMLKSKEENPSNFHYLLDFLSSNYYQTSPKMDHINPSSLCLSHFLAKMIQIYVFQVTLLLLLFTSSTISLSFNLTNFEPNGDIIFLNDSFASSGVIQLTNNQQDLSSLGSSVGRAYYFRPVQLWDKNKNKVTDFTTHFSFIIKAVDNTSKYGDGLSFYLAPVNSLVPDNSTGGYLGLVSPQSFDDTAKNTFVAVEFDSYENFWDPSPNHVGINVNSIVSVANVTWKSSINDGRKANAWVTYNSSTRNLSVFLTYADNPVFGGNSSLSYIIDLRTYLPEKIQVGFSASTGQSTEIHNILSWDFNSSLPDAIDNPKAGLIAGVVVGIFVLLVGLGIVGFFCRRRRVPRRSTENDEIDFSEDDDDDFERGTGPRRFTYQELSRATNNFALEGKLGEGGFGGVYSGRLLGDPSREIAVKRISSGSKQGKKEYVSEVKVISRLRHRNLVQLLGWSHDRGEFLLVYEFMPNGSLDYHLYGRVQVALPWTVRYKVAHGLASALLYLHEEWEQCVVHRDIKSSNVMLDSNFNAKLGDFGLARLVDHGLTGSQTTVLAGTLGYMAPECLVTGKANKQSDVYSFGVVALEISCGRRPVESNLEPKPSKVRMIEWVWTLYGKGILLKAVDERLEGVFDAMQIECLMVVGLWCCHPDHSQRPSIRQVLNVLNKDSPLPILPSKLPVPTYFAPPTNMNVFSTDSSSM